ncbi:MAG: hypothetical protein AABW48_01950 [Nanoarchaeota archaeon]
MKEIQLPKPTKGDDLVSKIRSAVSTLNAQAYGSRYEFTENPTGNSSDYVVNFGQLVRFGPCNDTPSFLVRFEAIRPEEQYSSVPFRTQEWGVHTMGPQDIDVDRDDSMFGIAYKKVVGQFIQMVLQQYGEMPNMPVESKRRS